MNCLCDNPILPLIILFTCCGENGGGLLGLGGKRSGNSLDDLLWLLAILCVCGNNGTSCDHRY